MIRKNVMERRNPLSYESLHSRNIHAARNEISTGKTVKQKRNA